MPEVTVAIPTFRRPEGLARLLAALAALETEIPVCILVADNDCDRREGFEVCCRLAPSYRWPLEAILVCERGIAQNRNALVEESLANRRHMDYLAMLDDD